MFCTPILIQEPPNPNMTFSNLKIMSLESKCQILKLSAKQMKCLPKHAPNTSPIMIQVPHNIKTSPFTMFIHKPKPNSNISLKNANFQTIIQTDKKPAPTYPKYPTCHASITISPQKALNLKITFGS